MFSVTKAFRAFVITKITSSVFLMKQPAKRTKKKESIGIKGTGEGLDFCNQCPFFGILESFGGQQYMCTASDKALSREPKRAAALQEIRVPEWCGNFKKVPMK